MQIICINGAPTSGKSTFAEMCCKYYQPCINISTVDLVKKIAKTCGWDGSKTPKNREFLSNLKDLLTEWDDVPYKDIFNQINEFYNQYIYEHNRPPQDLIVFVHVREPKEIQKFVDRSNAITLCIRRAAVEAQEQSNHADTNVFDFDYDYYIYNDSDLDTLQWKAAQFIEMIKAEYLKKDEK